MNYKLLGIDPRCLSGLYRPPRPITGESLSRRQIAIRNSDTPRERARERQEIARLMLETKKPMPSQRKSQPMPTAIEKRYAKFKTTCKRLDQERLQERIRKVRAFDAGKVSPRRAIAPLPADPLDEQIESQLQTQPAEFRHVLNRLYSAWHTHNESYFGGKLQLPILGVAMLKNAQADCSTHHQPSVIRFDVHTVRNRSFADVSDVLLHEMIHQCIDERDGAKACWGDNCSRGHHAEFARIANRIAKQRGWPDCSVKETVGPKAAQLWPPRTHF